VLEKRNRRVKGGERERRWDERVKESSGDKVQKSERRMKFMEMG
jgi:hypothetical protein